MSVGVTNLQIVSISVGRCTPQITQTLRPEVRYNVAALPDKVALWAEVWSSVSQIHMVEEENGL